MFIFYIFDSGGVVDSSHQPLVLQLMVVCPEDVCKVRRIEKNYCIYVYTVYVYIHIYYD
jgi:hypothetical protein